MMLVGAPVNHVRPDWRRVFAVARLDVADVIRSRWALGCAVLYTLLAAAFTAIGMRESDVLGFTGTARMLVSLGQVLVLLLPIVALGGTALVVNRARRDGTLELLFSHPVARTEYFLAVTLVRAASVVVPLALVLPAFAIGAHLAFGDPVPWLFLIRAVAIAAALAWCFVALGLWMSVVVDDPARAMVGLLAAWLLGVTLLDFGIVGAMLAWRWPPSVVFAAAAANPVEMARIALVANGEPTLATLGPVGLFLVQAIGNGPLLAAGIGWPLIAGAALWAHARRRLCRGDLV